MIKILDFSFGVVPCQFSRIITAVSQVLAIFFPFSSSLTSFPAPEVGLSHHSANACIGVIPQPLVNELLHIEFCWQPLLRWRSCTWEGCLCNLICCMLSSLNRNALHMFQYLTTKWMSSRLAYLGQFRKGITAG